MKAKKALKELRRRYVKKQTEQISSTKSEDITPVIITWQNAMMILDDMIKELEDDKSENKTDKES